MKLCTECRFYESSADELHDKCTNPKSEHGGVRSIELFSCVAMRAGICGKDADLFKLPLPVIEGA